MARTSLPSFKEGAMVHNLPMCLEEAIWQKHILQAFTIVWVYQELLYEMYIPKLIFKTPDYTLGKHWPLCCVTAALLPSKTREDEDRGMGSILESIHRWLWPYALTGKTEAFQTLPTELCKDVGEGNGNPLQCSCLENARDRAAWWAAVYGVAQSQTWLKRLSSSSSRLRPHHRSRGKKIALRMRLIKIRKLSEPHDGR